MAQVFDVTFKSLFRESRGVLSHRLFGEVVEWPNVEMPEVRNLRADVLARSADGALHHVEFQIKNDSGMPFRMLEYYVGFRRLYRQHIHQTLLYAGREPFNMPRRFESESVQFEYKILNLRELDGEDLLASDDLADNELALLTRADRDKVFRVVLSKLMQLPEAQQRSAATAFAIIGGILGIEVEWERRVREMTIDLMENQILGPAIRKGLEQGREQGLEEGREQGRAAAIRTLRKLIEFRFGPLPGWARERIAAATIEQIIAWSDRIDETTPLDKIIVD